MLACIAVVVADSRSTVVLQSEGETVMDLDSMPSGERKALGGRSL